MNDTLVLNSEWIVRPFEFLFLGLKSFVMSLSAG